MTITENDVETVRRFYAAFAAGDFETVRACFAPDAIWHLPGRGAIAGDHHHAANAGVTQQPDRARRVGAELVGEE